MTYSFRLLALLSFLSILLFISSCKEESFTPSVEVNIEKPQDQPTYQTPFFPQVSNIPFDQIHPTAYRHFIRQMDYVSHNNRSEYFLFNEIDVNNYIVHTSPAGTSYVWYLPTTGTNSQLYYNLVIEEYPDGYDEPFILEYELSDAFHGAFNIGDAGLDQFAGIKRKYLLEQVIGSRGLSFEYCYELIFADNGGGHGSYQDGPGTTTTTSSTSSNEPISFSGFASAFGMCLECVQCTCEGHSCGTGSCICGENGSGRRWYYVMQNCDVSNYVQQNGDQQNEDDGRGVLEDCYKILLDHGVMPPGYQHSDNSENDEVECVVSELDFIAENRFTLPGFKQNGVNLEECCDASIYEDCAWDEISLKYTLEFSWEDYTEILLPFLKANNLLFDDFGENIQEVYDFLKEYGADGISGIEPEDEYELIKFFNACPLKTFDYSKVGNSYTMLLEKNRQSVFILGPGEGFSYGPWNMCIVVNEKNDDGETVDKQEAAFLTAQAFEIARLTVAGEIINGETENPNAASNRFVFEFRNALNARFAGYQTVTPAAEGCLNVNVSRPYYNFFGVCLPQLEL